ncbi:hypothetical protein [Microcoleus sp. CAWBG58]|uniref:hypothetical protein n=1 Tax=Microcoleus sp. CAWBG58 TaxID=2841651 RepID=UPI0025D48921|nr:hypothetical protein [Microcoleus sp. CAWBG58]
MVVYPYFHHAYILVRSFLERGRSLPTNLMKKATWYRSLYNGYEPDNRIKLTGELIDDFYVFFEMWGSLTFNDGHSFVSIYRNENGEFIWRKGNETGTETSFMDAWEKMPAYVTDPDDYDDSSVTYLD